MFLDNDQLVHLQAMANAQAHFVVQQQSATGQTDSHAEDQDQQQGSYFNPYLSDNYETYPYYQTLNQDDVNQYGGGPEFATYRGQMYPHQGPIDIDGRVDAQSLAGVSSGNENTSVIGPTGANAMVSSPSVEEEIAKLQIADSDSDEPKHHKPDIAAAALNYNVNNETSPISQETIQSCNISKPDAQQ